MTAYSSIIKSILSDRGLPMKCDGAAADIFVGTLNCTAGLHHDSTWRLSEKG